MKTTIWGLVALGVVLLAAEAQAQRQLLASHETVAVFDGIKTHTCLGRTADCPWKCGDSGEYAEFSIRKYLAYKKLGQYGDPEQAKHSFQVSAYRGKDNRQPVGDPKIRELVNGLKPGDYVLLSWNHDYVTRGGSSFPERPLVKLEKIGKDKAEAMIGTPVGQDGHTSPATVTEKQAN